MAPDQYKFQMAIQDFQTARQQAALQEILARFTGKSAQLLSYDEVATKLKLHIRHECGIQSIPLNAIVGSVGRYNDFTRSFLPRREGDQERWARVKAAVESGLGLPPIEVYKVGDVYFVIDGNHRVSIARQGKLTSIQAHVIEFNTTIKLSPNIQPDDLIIKAEYADFIDTTCIHEVHPHADLNVTAPNQYKKLMEQIQITRYLLEEKENRSISIQDAAARWYESTYTPLAETIRDRGMLRWFPGRTITDLYVWISENRAALEEELGWELQSEVIATDLFLGKKVRSDPGSWRKARTLPRYTERLFLDILVPLSGESESWASLEQALIIARREGAYVHGLHVVSDKDKLKSPTALSVQEQFEQRCAEAGIEAKLVIEAGEITKRITERANLSDLIVLKIMHPPLGGISSLQSPFREVIVNSARPILGIPSQASSFHRALLAFDGGPRAREALFVATYFAEMWKTELFVFTSQKGSGEKDTTRDYARRYLDLHEVAAQFITSEQDPKLSIKKTVDEVQADLVLMGSYGSSVLSEVVIGSVLDSMLRDSRIPIFICR